MDRQTDKHTDRKTDRQTEREKKGGNEIVGVEEWGREKWGRDRGKGVVILRIFEMLDINTIITNSI